MPLATAACVLLHNNIGSNCRTDLEPIEGDRSAQSLRGKKSSQNPQGSWAEAGEPPRRELEWATFLKKGEPTGKWEVLKCNLAKAAKDGAARWEDKNGATTDEARQR
jgi:hypothetical protein